MTLRHLKILLSIVGYGLFLYGLRYFPGPLEALLLGFLIVHVTQH